MPLPLTQDFVKAALEYDPETGIFRWRLRTDMPKEWNTRRAGKIAGTLMLIGYRSINVSAQGQYRGAENRYLAHRLAWLYMTGQWPPDQIDHINGDRADNRFVNLRLATISQNKRNAAPHRRNRSGIKNVHWHAFSQSWHVRVWADGREHSFGYFRNIEEAAEKAREARLQLHGDYAATTNALG